MRLDVNIADKSSEKGRQFAAIQNIYIRGIQLAALPPAHPMKCAGSYVFAVVPLAAVTFEQLAFLIAVFAKG
jgi:hypothetical protein